MKLGTIYNSNANVVYQIINWIGVIAGIGCVAMILFSLVKIMTGDEGDRDHFLRRIKHGLIALVLILTITSITNLITKYFNPSIVAKTSGIGDFRGYTSAVSDNLANNIKDVENRPMIMVDGSLYVRTDKEKNVGFDGSWTKKICVNVFKRYDDCQGATKGAFAEDCYYVFKWNAGGFGSDIDEKWRRNDNYLILAEAVKTTSVTDDDDYNDFMNRYAIKKGSAENGGWYYYTKESNPFSENATKSKEQTDKEKVDAQFNKTNPIPDDELPEVKQDWKEDLIGPGAD